jgi:hypothetical protein
MTRSRFFAALSLITAVSLAASSVASARLLAPMIPGSNGSNSLILKVDKWKAKRERKRVEWDRSYNDRGRTRDRYRDRRGPGRSPPHSRSGSGREYRGHYDRGRALPPRQTIVVRPVPPRQRPRVVPPPHRRYHYRNVWVHRPYGHWYRGYGHHYHDRDAYRWLAFTAITISLLSLLTVAQQRAQEQAQIEATTAPVGSTIAWNDSRASGSVSVLRDGRSSDGQYCREFQQTVTVGGRSEQAYGVACRQPDGAWRIVNTR